MISPGFDDFLQIPKQKKMYEIWWSLHKVVLNLLFLHERNRATALIFNSCFCSAINRKIKDCVSWKIRMLSFSGIKVLMLTSGSSKFNKEKIHLIWSGTKLNPFQNMVFIAIFLQQPIASRTLTISYKRLWVIL